MAQATLLNTVFGNKRLLVMSVTASAATFDVTTSLQAVEGVAVGIKTATTGAVKFQMGINILGGTANASNIGVSGAAAGDVFLLTVIGH